GGVTAISLKIMQNADRTVKLTVDLPGVATWEKDNVHGCLNRSLELPKISSSSLCSAANPVTVTPVYFSDSDLLPKGACVTNAALGCSPDGTSKSLTKPFTGVCPSMPPDPLNTGNCGLSGGKTCACSGKTRSGGCGCGSCGCSSGSPSGVDHADRKFNEFKALAQPSFAQN